MVGIYCIKLNSYTSTMITIQENPFTFALSLKPVPGQLPPFPSVSDSLGAQLGNRDGIINELWNVEV